MKTTVAKTAKQYLATCKKYLGCKESDGSHKKIIDIFNMSKLKTFSLSYDDPWCAGYVSAMACESGCDDIIPISGNCDEMYKKGLICGIAINKNEWIPVTGDIVFYDWNLNGELDHVGIVDSRINFITHVIEGNKSNSVSYRDIDYRDKTITKILRPRYKTETIVKNHSYKAYCNTAIKVINGKYGNGNKRKEKLEKAGYSYEKVQGIVDVLLK